MVRQSALTPGLTWPGVGLIGCASTECCLALDRGHIVSRTRTSPARGGATVVGTLPAGPFGSLRLAGHDVPFYVIPFDKDGALQASATAARLVSDVAASVGDGDAAPGVTDVIVVVHGWNTDFKGALALARDLISRLDATIADHGTPRADFRPLVVAISWPSIVLSSSNAPAMAAAPMDDVDLDGLSVLAQEVVAPEKRGEFYELAQANYL